MKMSTRARYGARAMAELAVAWPDRSLSVKELAQLQGLSAKYLEQIMATLKNAGLVKAVRGLHGGYELGASPDKISLCDVYEALEGSPALVECVNHPETCPKRNSCPTRDTWVQLNEAMQGILKATTLDELAERKLARSASSAPTYEI
jgi:Rrf2 family transcriptional regulator, cysteine metabolism repressor